MRSRNGGYSASGGSNYNGGYSASGGSNYNGGYSAHTQGGYQQPSDYGANYGHQQVTVSKSHSSLFGGRHYHQSTAHSHRRGYQPIDEVNYPQPLCGCNII